MSAATLKNQSSREEAEILAAIEMVHKALQGKDAAAIAAQYAQDAVLFNPAPPLSHRGMDLQELQQWLDTWGEPVDLELRDFKITVSGDFAFCRIFYQLRGTKKGVSQPISFWMCATVCLHRDEDAWRITHEHTSVPFYMDGSPGAAFGLKPRGLPREGAE